MTSFPTISETSLALMNLAWTQTSITQSDTLGIMGMYGVAGDPVDKYYFYMQFTADSDDAWWDTTVLEKHFRVIF